MAKNNKNQEDQKPEDQKPDYSTTETKSDAGDIPLTQETIGEKSIEKKKLPEKNIVQGIFKKVYVNVHGVRKHYLKLKGEQKEIIDPVTKLEIMVSEDGKECSYYENLNDSEIKSYKLF